jgi:putative FmdB family regulatory protein
MPIYEFACSKCRRVFSFLSKRVSPEHSPVCPRCGNRHLAKQMSRFAMTQRRSEPSAKSNPGEAGAEPPMPELDDPKIMRAMSELERDMEHLDENNPKHIAHLMKKMKDALPPGTLPTEMDVAIKRLEKGEDPEKIEAEMGDMLGQLMGGPEDEDGGGGGAGYTRDRGLYDY